MGIYKDCLKDRFHALVSWSVPLFAGPNLSASQINIAGAPNVLSMVIFLSADKRYCNIKIILLTPGLRGFCFNYTKKGVASSAHCIKNRGTGTPFDRILPWLLRDVNHLFHFFTELQLRELRSLHMLVTIHSR